MMELNIKKIAVVFGTRAEATKLAPLIIELKKYPQWFKVLVIVTGQHKEQLYQALDSFKIKPDIDLDIMREQQSLLYILSTAVNALDNVFKNEKPDLVIVHGDTQTTICGSLVAYYNKLPLAHVEAGLRSFLKYSPWPEEGNRRIVDAIADLFFAPTIVNKENLIKEGISEKNIYITGQTQVDAAIAVSQQNYKYKEERLNELDFDKKIILVTAHRRENYGLPMENMFRAIRRIADKYLDVTVVYPVHLSPYVQKTARDILENHQRIILFNPIEYCDMINLMSKANIVMSDSGGLQEECPVFNKPLVLMRDTTERPEGIEAGVTNLCGTNEDDVFQAADTLLKDFQIYKSMANSGNPFGDGKASERIVKIIANFYGYINTLPDEFYYKK